MLQDRNEWDDKFKEKKEKICQTNIPYLVSNSQKKKKDKQKLELFITTRHVLQETLKGVLKVQTIGHWTVTQKHTKVYNLLIYVNI